MDALEVLGLEPGYTDEDLKQAFREKARLVHPDANPSSEAHWQMIQVNQAYNALKARGRGGAPTLPRSAVKGDPAYVPYKKAIELFQSIHPSGWVKVSESALFNPAGTGSKGNEAEVLRGMLGRIQQSYALFSTVVNDHPGSAWAADAAAKLRALDRMAPLYAKIARSFA